MFRWDERPSQIEAWIEDVDEKAVFGEALMALGDVLTEERGGAPVMRDIEAGADSPARLLAAWLDALAALARDEGFVAERVVHIDLADDRVEARVAGQLLAPRKAIKAATCHRLEMRESDGAWHAHVVLDSEDGAPVG